MPNSRLTINLAKIEQTLRELQAQVGGVMPMIKAQAYGTNAFQMARFFEEKNIETLGLSHLDEAIELRRMGIASSLFVLCASQDDAQLVADYDLEVALTSKEQALALNATGKNIKVHLHVNTGMNRFGIAPDQVLPITHLIDSLPYLQCEGIMTHLSGAARSEFDAITHEQIAIFKGVLSQLPALPSKIHVANSAGAKRFSLPFCTHARIGLTLFEEALLLESKVVHTHEVEAGQSVGYLPGYRALEKMKVAVLGIGYHDGFCSSCVSFAGKKAPVVGPICMDFCMIDVSDIPTIKVGDQAQIFGPDLPLREIAQETNVRKILTQLGPRIERNFVKEGQQHDSKDLSEALCTLS